MTHPDWKEAAEKWLRDNNWDYQKYGDRRGDRSAYDTLMNYEIKEYLGDAFQAGAEHGYEDGYDDGLLKGSEVGDATAKRALKERDLDMERLQKERIEFVTERDQLKQQLEVSAENYSKLVQQLSEMTWEYENACKFATDFEQQRDKLKAEVESYKKAAHEWEMNWASEREANEKLQKKCGTCDGEGVIYLPISYDYISGEKLGPAEPCPECDEMARLRAANAKLREALEFISCEGMDDGDFYEKEFDDLVIGTIAMANVARQALHAAKQDETNYGKQ